MIVADLDLQSVILTLGLSSRSRPLIVWLQERRYHVLGYVSSSTCASTNLQHAFQLRCNYRHDNDM